MVVGIVLFIDGGWSAGLCCFDIIASAETSWVPFIVVDKVVADNHADGKQTARTEWDGINR